MSKIQQKVPGYQWLFRNFNDANKAVKMIREMAIIMLGLTRVGKSTLFNSIINPESLIGKQIEANCYYVPTSIGGRQINPAAKISHKMVSETLLPNMRNIKQGGYMEITIIDMPGAGQRREGSKVLLTSYVLTSVFENLKQAKFILVMTESSFISIADNCFRNTLQEFLCLFNFSAMKPEIRQQLFKSVSLVITSVRPSLANKLLGQLSLNLKNLRELYLQNQQYMPNFEFCQMLINSIIQSNRIEPFLLAQNGVPAPKQSKILSSLASKKWRYCQVNKIIKQVEYPYIRYFKLYLNPGQQKQVESYIQARFKQLKHLQIQLDHLILHFKTNICNKNLDIRPFLERIHKKFILNDFYQDMPRNLIIKNNLPTQMVNLRDRVQKIILIQNHNKNLKLIYEWRSQINSEAQIYKQIPNSVYYQKFLLNHFNQKIQYVIDLCSSQEAIDIFAQIRHIFNKLFFQSSTLDCLRKGSELKDFNLRSILQNEIHQYLFLIREEDENKLVMEIFKDFYKFNFNSSDLRLNEIEEIIAFFFNLQKKYPELDSIQVYKLLYKMKKIKIDKIQKEVKGDRERQIIKEKLAIIYYATCHIISLQYVQNASDSERIIQALTSQRAVASDIIRLLHALGGPSIKLAHNLCDMLELYKDKSFLFQKEIQSKQRQKGPGKLQAIYNAAKHQQKIGNTTNCLFLYDRFRREGGKILNGIDPVIQVRNNAQQMIQTSQKCKIKQERTPLNSQKVFQCLKQCYRSLFNVNIDWPFNVEKIGSAYRAKMAKMNQEGQINKELPKNPASIQLIEQCSQMIKICKNKKLTILIGSRRYCGLTTLSYALQKKRLINFQGGKYQIEINSKSSKINHTSSSPNEFPNIFKINEEEWIIDFPNIFPYDPQIALIKGNILQKFIQESNGFRIILVTNQEGFLQSQGFEFINLLKFIMKIFPKKQFKIEQALGFAVTMFSAGFDNVKKIRQAEKLLLNRFKKHKDDQMQIIENEKKFKLSQAQQFEMNQILKEVISKGARMLRFERPNQAQEQNTSNFLEQLTKNGGYINRQVYMQPNSFQIGLTINNSFEDSECQRIIGNIRFLINQIKRLLKQLGYLTDQKIGQLIQDSRNFPPEFDSIQRILNDCSIITSKSKVFHTTGTKYQDRSDLQKTIISYRDIIQHITRENKFEEFYLPDDSIKYISYAEEMVKDVFKKITNFICSNDADTVPIIKAQSTAIILLNQLKWICEPLIFSTGKIRQRICQLREMSDAFAMLFDANLSDVINSFKKKIKIERIMKLPYNDQKQNCLTTYNQIISMISNGQNSQQFFEMKKNIISSLQDLFLKNGKSKQLCLIILEQIQINLVRQKLKNIEAIEDLLRNIAENIVLLHPKLGFQICRLIQCPDTLQIICKRLIDFSADPKWKLQAYIEHYIVLHSRQSKRSTNTVQASILSFIGYNHPDYQLLSSPNGIKSRALNLQINLVFQPDVESILKITSYIRQQINMI